MYLRSSSQLFPPLLHILTFLSLQHYLTSFLHYYTFLSFFTTIPYFLPFSWPTMGWGRKVSVCEGMKGGEANHIMSGTFVEGSLSLSAIRGRGGAGEGRSWRCGVILFSNPMLFLLPYFLLIFNGIIMLIENRVCWQTSTSSPRFSPGFRYPW